MRQVSKQWVVAVSALMMALIAVPSEARPSHGDNGAEQGRAENRAPIDQNRAAAMVQGSTGGRVLAVETVVQGGRKVHRVKVLLSGGRIRIVNVDGKTGEMH